MTQGAGPAAARVLRAMSHDGRAVVLNLRGEHDLSNAPFLRQDLLEVADRGLVVLDFTGCDFVDSTVLGVLAGAARRLQEGGGRLVGVGATGMTRNALRVTAMEELLHEPADLPPDVAALLAALHEDLLDELDRERPA